MTENDVMQMKERLDKAVRIINCIKHVREQLGNIERSPCDLNFVSLYNEQTAFNVGCCRVEITKECGEEILSILKQDRAKELQRLQLELAKIEVPSFEQKTTLGRQWL